MLRQSVANQIGHGESPEPSDGDESLPSRAGETIGEHVGQVVAKPVAK